MFTKLLLTTGFALGLGIASAAAQSCGGVYTVKRGDTLSQIADIQYKDARKWSVIYSNNLKTIGGNPNAIRVGAKYNLSCIGGLPLGLEGGAQVVKAAVEPEATTTSSVAPNARKISILTGDAYAPFTDRGLLNGGLITDLVDTAMKGNSDVAEYTINWSNDWVSHLDQLLPSNLVDMSFPWIKPDCVALPDHERCRFVYSEPMFEMLMLLFTNKSNPMKFTQDSDALGKTFCRPQGYTTHIFEKDGRNWIKDGKITLKQPGSLKECFDMLLDGSVDAVALNEFTGRGEIKKLDIVDKIEVIATRPLSIEGLHVIAYKENPEADELISIVNASLEKIKKSGAYQKVIDAQMTEIWKDF